MPYLALILNAISFSFLIFKLSSNLVECYFLRAKFNQSINYGSIANEMNNLFFAMNKCHLLVIWAVTLGHMLWQLTLSMGNRWYEGEYNKEISF